MLTADLKALLPRPYSRWEKAHQMAFTDHLIETEHPLAPVFQHFLAHGEGSHSLGGNLIPADHFQGRSQGHMRRLEAELRHPELPLDPEDEDYLNKVGGSPRNYFVHSGLPGGFELHTGKLFDHKTGKHYLAAAFSKIGWPPVFIHAPVTKEQFVAIHRAFPGQVRKSAAEAYERALEQRPVAPKYINPDLTQLARSKAPEGGMIVNGTYYEGGKFLPRLLKRIRTVRRNAAPVQLARLKMSFTDDEIKHLQGINPEDRAGMASFADHLQENDHPLWPLFARLSRYNPDNPHPGKQTHRWDHGRIAPGVSVFSGITKLPKGSIPFIQVLHVHQGNTPTYKVYTAPVSPDELHQLHSRLAGTRLSGTLGVPHKIQGIPQRGLKSPDQLAREPDAPAMTVARVLPSGAASFHLDQIPDEHIKELEQVYNVPKSIKLTEGPRTVEKLHKFLDHIGKQEVPKNLRGDKAFTHILAHAVKDATDYLKIYDGSEWYGSSVKKLEEGLHDLLSRETPFDPNSPKVENHRLWGRKGEKTGALKLLKMIVGFTSNNQSPVDNLNSTLKILKTGLAKDPERPFEQLDEYNHKPKEDFLHHLTKVHGAGDHSYVGLTEDERTKWYQKYGGELKGNPVSMLVALRNPEGRIVGRVNLRKQKVDFPGNPLPPGKYQEVPFPSVDAEGRLKSKGWSSRASTNADHIRLLKHIIQQTGGYEQAADWLETRHPKAEVEKMKGGPVNTGELAKGELVPGMFAFGPKQGPFYSNISGNPEHVTQDVWWTRAINRWLGKLTKNEKAPTVSQKQFYARIAREASKKLGMTPADLQAALWYAEQHLYRLFGVRAESQDFAQAINHALSAHGFQH